MSSVNVHERSEVARRQSIEIHGTSCAVCKFDFGKVYGAIGVGFIPIHHLKELSAIGKSYKVNSRDDLRPECANCHAMLHQRKPAYSIDELRALMLSAAR